MSLAPSAAPSALIVENGVITWVGTDAELRDLAVAHARITDVEGALITPGFVDAHVHATSTGLTLLGLDLSAVRSADDLLDELAAVHEPPSRIILGHGWDESQWTNVTLPTRDQLDHAARGARVYLTRADAHSALVSSALIAAVPDCRGMRGFDESGWVTQEAHHALREYALGSVATESRTRAQEAFLAHAVRCGIVSVHEMAGPVISSVDDCRDLLATAARVGGTQVIAYWGELAQAGGIETARELGARGTGGDLFVDGSFGSHTACLHESYTDLPDSHGRSFLDSDAVVEHVDLCVRADIQTGFHAIGDAANDAVIEAFAQAARVHGTERVRSHRHRIEHAEALSAANIEMCAHLGLVASMQPVFDARWGGSEGMYAARLGAIRAAALNPIGDLRRSGVAVAFGSDAPVTPLDPWGAVRAAVNHRNSAQRIEFSEALDSHTRLGWHAAGIDDAGRIAVGQAAHLGIWGSGGVDAYPSSGSTALRTVIDGMSMWDSGELTDISC